MDIEKIRKLCMIQLLKAHGEILLYQIKIAKLKLSSRRFAVRQMLRGRQMHGFYHNLVQEMRLQDSESFTNFHRLDRGTFEELLKILGPSLRNLPTRQQEQITEAERLSLTLRYLASGDSMVSVGFYGYRIGKSTTSKIIRETCQLLWEKLAFVFPKSSTSGWRNIAKEFYNKWDFPNCLGAIDGKHVVVQALPKYNSLTFNYKHSHSLILLAVSDADYKFIMVDIGALGHNSDASIFRKSKFGRAILEESETLCLPPPEILTGTNQVAPFVFVADEAFPLHTNLMRPYPGRSTGNLPQEHNVFNYRLSRARRVVENAFGILASRWRVYRKPIIASKDTIVNIIKATVCLHNWLRERQTFGYVTEGLVDTFNADGTMIPGQWREVETHGMVPIGRTGANNSTRQAAEIRNIFTNYFSDRC